MISTRAIISSFSEFVLVGETLPAWMQVLEQCREQLPVAFLLLVQLST